ncbi:MAG: hypothetical protein ABIR96_10365, partial [Bdellovibrionota bacterium]
MACKRKQKWALALFSTFFFLLTACGAKPEAVLDSATATFARDAQTLSLSWLETALAESDSAELTLAIQDVQ